MRRIASMAQGYQICHCEERSDVAISQNPTGQQGSHRRNRNCLPEIAPQGHFLALRAQGATSACGLLAMTRQVVPWCISALTQLNYPILGAHNPQGARRIRKAAKPPTAAQ